jgi:hypothetical protein
MTLLAVVSPLLTAPSFRTFCETAIACLAIAVTWYASVGNDPAQLQERRANAPWYTTKAEPCTSDIAATLRRVLITARFKVTRPDQPTSQEIHAIRLAWEDAA